MKYRKLPVVIDAFRWTGELNNADEWFIDALASGKAMFEGGELKIVTLEGVMAVSKSDYIIRGVAGEIYPCKPTIFYRTYTLNTIDEVD
jgi:hypothetical protein